MIIKRILTLILGLALCHNVHGQIRQDQSCFSNIYIDRPMLQADSFAIISNNVSKIKLYESISSDSIPKKTLLGEWKVEIENQKIKSITWIAYTDSLFHTKNNSYVLLGCYPLVKRDFKKNKIIDIIETPKYSDGSFSKFQFTHLINKYGKIYQSNIKSFGNSVEDRYLFLDKIEYRYDGNFAIETDYFSSWFFIENHSLYSRLYYEYEKSE